MRRRRVGRSAAGWAGALACAASASGAGWSLEASADLALQPVETEESVPALDAPSLSSWAASIEPMWWYPGLFGDLRIEGSTSTAAIEDIGVDEPQSTPAIEASLRDGDLTVRMSGFIFSQTADAEAQAPFTIGGYSAGPGDVVSSSVDLSSFQATLGTLLWETTLDGGEREPVHMRLDGFAGARIYDFDFTIGPPGATTARDNATWFDLIVGARLEVEITRSFSFDVTADVGGLAWDGAGSASANIIAGFQWRPVPNVGAQIGYRFLYTGYNDGDDGAEEFDFTGSLAGLYGSVVLRF
ncbi:MAG: hypothetical protein ACF8QF_11035 [Phycisphaerales bacterium]